MMWEIFDLIINILIWIWKLTLLWAQRIKSCSFCQKTAQPSSFEFQSWLCEIKVLTPSQNQDLLFFPKRHLDLNLRLSRFLSPDSPGLGVSTFSSYSAIVVSVRHKSLILRMLYIQLQSLWYRLCLRKDCIWIWLRRQTTPALGHRHRCNQSVRW